MRRLVVVLCLLLVSLLAFTNVGQATHIAALNDGSKDFAVAGGHHAAVFTTDTEQETQFEFSMHSGTNGEDPKGQMSYKRKNQPRVRADVDCFRVLGKLVFASGRITSPDSKVDKVLLMQAVDTGGPNKPPPDLVGFSIFDGGSLTATGVVVGGCVSAATELEAVEKGNVLVRDRIAAPPTP